MTVLNVNARYIPAAGRGVVETRGPVKDPITRLRWPVMAHKLILCTEPVRARACERRICGCLTARETQERQARRGLFFSSPLPYRHRAGVNFNCRLEIDRIRVRPRVNSSSGNACFTRNFTSAARRRGLPSRNEEGCENSSDGGREMSGTD